MPMHIIGGHTQLPAGEHMQPGAPQGAPATVQKPRQSTVRCPTHDPAPSHRSGDVQPTASSHEAFVGAHTLAGHAGPVPLQNSAMSH